MLVSSFVLDPTTRAFYTNILIELRRRQLPFAVAGAYALRHHTGIVRQTKDLDLFVLRQDIERVLELLSAAGYKTELTHAHWLGKVYDRGDDFVDIIFSSGNGVANVDADFFTYATDGELFDVPIKWCPVEEMVWSKAYVMERERYDGADVAHLLHVCGSRIDWPRLLARFGEHWRLLFSHLVLFGFIYPADRSSIPGWVMRELSLRLAGEVATLDRTEPICGGTLLSREQFLIDVHDWGYLDARLTAGAMSEREIADWTAAIDAMCPGGQPSERPRYDPTETSR